MQEQGTAPTNPSSIANLTAQINAIDLCADLNAVVGPALASIQAEIDAVNAEVNKLLSLMTPPSGLSGCISWITNYINSFSLPHSTLVTQLTTMAQEMSDLISAITAAAARIENCTITIPTISGLPPVPPAP